MRREEILEQHRLIEVPHQKGVRKARCLPEHAQELGAVFRLPSVRVEVALDAAEAKPRLLSGSMHPLDQRDEVREAGLVEVHERDRVVLQHLRELRLRLDRHRHRQFPVARCDSIFYLRRRALRLPPIYLIVLRMFSASHVKSPLHTSRVRSGEARSAFRPDRTRRHAPIPVRLLM